jgi:hypothetical protein
MFDKGKLRLFWHLIKMDSNSKPRQVWERRAEEPGGRGRPRIQLEEYVGMQAWKKREESAGSDQTGEEQESVPDVADATRRLKGR